MGCKPSKKDLRSNIIPNDPSIIVGSTMLRADKIIVLGDSVFLPTQDHNGESAIFEISVSDKKMSVYRGWRNALVRSGLKTKEQTF